MLTAKKSRQYRDGRLQAAQCATINNPSLLLYHTEFDYTSAGYDACREQTNARRPHCSARCVMRQCAPCGTHVSITVVLVAPCQYPVAPCQQWPIIKYSVPGRLWPRAWLRVRARARLNATQLFPRPSSTLVGAEVRLSLPSLLSRVTKVAAR